jgi:hypothetical protein
MNTHKINQVDADKINALADRLFADTLTRSQFADEISELGYCWYDLESEILKDDIASAVDEYREDNSEPSAPYADYNEVINWIIFNHYNKHGGVIWAGNDGEFVSTYGVVRAAVFAVINATVAKGG